MTTIAWDGKTLAADRCANVSGLKIRVSKLHKLKDGKIIGCSGDFALCKQAIDWLDGKGEPPVAKEDEFFTLLIIDKDRKCWRMETGLVMFLVEEPFHAAGSGRDFAIAAMALGLTAQAAVELATQFDPDTSLGVDTMKPKRRTKCKI